MVVIVIFYWYYHICCGRMDRQTARGLPATVRPLTKLSGSEGVGLVLSNPASVSYAGCKDLYGLNRVNIRETL